MDTIDNYIKKYGEPLYRQKITGLTEDERMIGDIPYEIAVFKISYPSEVMVVGKLKNGNWIPNFGERSTIHLLLSERRRT